MAFLRGIRAWLREALAVEQSIDAKMTAIIEGMNNQSQLLNSKFEALVGSMNHQSALLNSKFEALIAGMTNQSERLNSKLEALIAGMTNQSELLNGKLEALIAGSTNQSELLNSKLEALIAGTTNQSELLNDKLEALVAGTANQSELLNGKFDALIVGTTNQSALLNRKLSPLIQGTDDHSRVLDRGFKTVVAGLDNQSRLLNSKLDAVIVGLGNQPPMIPPSKRAEPVAAAKPQPSSLLIAEKTYNTSHPDYDVTVVRNFPTKILNAEVPCRNPVYADLKKLAAADTVSDAAWTPVLQGVLAEAKTVAHADLVLHRRDTLEQYLADLERRYGARYIAGWVNLDDALFLYWLVRSLRPKTIVQCGVCNGLSSAFMMLALAKNGPDGQLHVIDMPPVFNSKDPAWTIAGKTYGMVVPEGKTSGWIVPEAYRSRFHVQNGDAKILLPKLVERLPTIDMFYHDSDHTYNHMMFEFREAKRKLTPGGLIVADDISWNAALWDFADECKAPAYNFKGAVGVTFL